MRGFLLLSVVFAVVVAGCAEGPGGGGELATPSTSEAAALFGQAAENMPDVYGVTMKVTRDAKELMTAEGVFDEARQTGYFTIKMDASLAEGSGEGGMGMSFPEEGFGMYTSPEGSAFVVGKSITVMPPGENAFMSQAEENEGFAAIADPDELFEEMTESNFTVTSVTSTELRGKPALKLEGTFVDDEEGPQNVTVYLFQEPTRIARLEMVAPADEEEFAGALMTMDVLYDDEISAEVPDAVRRAMGLRYQSDRQAFGGFGSGGSGSEDGPETWTFQADGGIALAEVAAEVGEGMGGVGGMDGDEETPPLWTMKLSEGSKSEEGLTLTFADVDGDGTVSQGDTLTIERGEGAEHLSVALRDLATGYKVTPGAGLGLLLVAFAFAGLVARRG